MASSSDIFACLAGCTRGPLPQPVSVIVTLADLDVLITAAQQIAPSVDRERLRRKANPDRYTVPVAAGDAGGAGAG